MDELDLLKKDWKRQEKTLPQLEIAEIRTMMHKKSTSIVKWIFIISIAEFLFWIGVESFSFFDESYDIINDLGLNLFYKISMAVTYVTIFIFITLFFFNFRNIKTSDNVKVLMKNIIKTRRTVKYYVWFNLIFFLLASFVIGYLTIDKLYGDLDLEAKLKLGAILFGMVAILFLLLLGFYKLLYGILTRRLYNNYQALRKIEMKD